MTTGPSEHDRERFKALTTAIYHYDQAGGYLGSEWQGTLDVDLIEKPNVPAPLGAARGFCNTMAAGLGFAVEFDGASARFEDVSRVELEEGEA